MQQMPGANEPDAHEVPQHVFGQVHPPACVLYYIFSFIILQPEQVLTPILF